MDARTNAYLPSRSDLEAMQIAKSSDVAIFQTPDKLWSWSWPVNGTSRSGLLTQWHAAQDALIGMNTH